MGFFIGVVVILPIGFIFVRVKGTDYGYCPEAAVAVLPCFIDGSRAAVFFVFPFTEVVITAQAAVSFFLEVIVFYPVCFFACFCVFFIFSCDVELFGDDVSFLFTVSAFFAAQGAGAVFVTGFAAVGGDFIEEVALVGGDPLGGDAGAGDVDEPLGGLVGVFFFAAIDGGACEDGAVQPVAVVRRVGFFFCLVGDGFPAYAAFFLCSLNGDGCQYFFVFFPAVMEFDFPADGVGDFAEVNAVCVGVADGVAVGVFLQRNDAVFVEVGAQSGFVAQQVFTGSAVDGFVPVFEFDVFVAVVFETPDGIASAGSVLFCFNGDDAGAAVMKIGGSFFLAFFFCERDGFYPREVIPPAAGDSVYVVVFVADDFRALGSFFRFDDVLMLHVSFFIAGAD